MQVLPVLVTVIFEFLNLSAYIFENKRNALNLILNKVLSACNPGMHAVQQNFSIKIIFQDKRSCILLFSFFNICLKFQLY